MSTWTYAGTPGTSTASERRDAVRFLVGDTDNTDKQTFDEEITFALSEANDDVYKAAAIVARTLEAKFARLVDISFDAVKESMSQKAQAFAKLAIRLEKKAASMGGGLGVPAAGGISISDMDSAEDDSDRPEPAFKRGQFRNPPENGDVEDFLDYHK